MAAPTTDEEEKLQYTLNTFLGIPEADWQRNPAYGALTVEGVTDFQEFTHMSKEDINNLKFIARTSPTDTEMLPLPGIYRRQLLIVLSMFHVISSKRGGSIDIRLITRATYDDYRTRFYDPNKDIKPWGLLMKENDQNSELAQWQKSVKLDAKAYPPLKDETHWVKHKRKMEIALQSHSLQDLIDDTIPIRNREVDKAKRDWLYKVMSDTYIVGTAKTIVENHEDDKDTRAIWKEIYAHYESSIQTQIFENTLSTFLTSTRFEEQNWRGTLQSQIQHYRDQARLHTKVSAEAYTDRQLIQFLQAAVRGIAGLRDIYTQQLQSRAALGRPLNISFDEYVQLLNQQAQLMDSARNTKSSLKVNIHEVEQQMIDEIAGLNIDQLEVNMAELMTQLEWDANAEWDVNVAQQNNQNNFRRHTSMNRETWESLTPEDKKTWDEMSGSGKDKILRYAIARLKMIQENNGQSQQASSRPSAPQGQRRFGQNQSSNNRSNPQRSSNVHEVQEAGETEATADTIEANVHESRTSNPISKTPDNDKAILDVATSKNKVTEANLNKILSQVTTQKTNGKNLTIETNHHELLPRSNIHCSMAKWKTNDDDEEDDEEEGRQYSDPSIVSQRQHTDLNDLDSMMTNEVTRSSSSIASKRNSLDTLSDVSRPVPTRKVEHATNRNSFQKSRAPPSEPLGAFESFDYEAALAQRAMMSPPFSNVPKPAKTKIIKDEKEGFKKESSDPNRITKPLRPPVIIDSSDYAEGWITQKAIPKGKAPPKKPANHPTQVYEKSQIVTHNPYLHQVIEQPSVSSNEPEKATAENASVPVTAKNEPVDPSPDKSTKPPAKDGTELDKPTPTPAASQLLVDQEEELLATARKQLEDLRKVASEAEQRFTQAQKELHEKQQQLELEAAKQEKLRKQEEERLRLAEAERIRKEKEEQERIHEEEKERNKAIAEQKAAEAQRINEERKLIQAEIERMRISNQNSLAKIHRTKQLTEEIEKKKEIIITGIQKISTHDPNDQTNAVVALLQDAGEETTGKTSDLIDHDLALPITETTITPDPQANSSLSDDDKDEDQDEESAEESTSTHHSNDDDNKKPAALEHPHDATLAKALQDDSDQKPAALEHPDDEALAKALQENVLQDPSSPVRSTSPLDPNSPPFVPQQQQPKDDGNWTLKQSKRTDRTNKGEKKQKSEFVYQPITASSPKRIRGRVTTQEKEVKRQKNAETITQARQNALNDLANLGATTEVQAATTTAVDSQGNQTPPPDTSATSRQPSPSEGSKDQGSQTGLSGTSTGTSKSKSSKRRAKQKAKKQAEAKAGANTTPAKTTKHQRPPKGGAPGKKKDKSDFSRAGS